jgi:agmatine/peptidylarginine deiminase
MSEPETKNRSQQATISREPTQRQIHTIAGRVLLVVLPIALVIFLVYWGNSNNQQRQQAEDQLHETVEKLADFQRLDEQSFAEFSETFENLTIAQFYREEPLTSVSIDSLRRTRTFYESFVNRVDENSHPLMVAFARLKMGAVYFATRDMKKAEGSYERARQLLIGIINRSDLLDAEVGLAIANSRMSCLLANVGALEKARLRAREAVSALTNLCDADPMLQLELLTASCNLAIIDESLGHTGIDGLQQCIRHVAATVSQLHDGVCGPELLADANQLLMGFFWKRRQWKAAERACLQTCKILGKRIHELQHSPEGKLDQPTFKHRRALIIANENLGALQDDRACEDLSETEKQGNKPSYPLPGSSWRWQSLYAISGRSVPHELLIRYRLHGEFEHQDGLMLVWPDEVWGNVPALQIVKSTCQNIQVVLLVQDPLSELEARQALRRVGVDENIVLFKIIPTNTVWIRDYGPLAVDDELGRHRILDSDYSFGMRLLDDRVPLEVSQHFGCPDAYFSIELDIDWGALVCNGADLCLVSNAILKRNLYRGFDEVHITNTIRRVTGARKVIYLEPLHGEPTGHLDMMMTFTSADTILLGDYRSNDPRNAQLLDEHAKLLSAEMTSSGAPLNVVRIPMPTPTESGFAGTYTNVVFANGIVLIPTWSNTDSALEAEVFSIYQRLLPGWKTVGVNSDELGIRAGALHCATMNLYRVPSWFKRPES